MGVDAWNEINSPDIFKLDGLLTEDEYGENFGWWKLPEVIGDRFIAPLLNAPEGTCIVMPNASTIMQQLLSSKELNAPGKRKIVSTDGEFSAVSHTLSSHNTQFEQYPEEVRDAVGIKPKIVNFSGKEFNAEDITAEIDDETALVVFSHVGFLRGELVPAEEIQKIVRKAREHGALVAIDGYHAIGSHRIDVQNLGVDVYFGGLLKEGSGSSGNAFLYIRDGLELTPKGAWFGADKPFAFKSEHEPHKDVRRRFLSGTTAIASMYHGVEGVKIMLELGIENVVEDIRAKVQYIVEHLDAETEIVSPKKPERMSAMIVLKISEADKLKKFLADEYNVLVDARQNAYLRLAPHIYNSPEQIIKAVSVIIECVRNQDYKNISLEASGGPVT
jgi:kynureninase